MRDYLTYRYPRTLVEAFGCDARSAIAVHGPYRKAPLWADLLAVVAIIAAIVIFGAALYQ